MIPKSHDDHGTVLHPASIALVADKEGNLDLLIPQDLDVEMSRSQLFLSAVAFRSTDAEWVHEQLEFIVEARRQFDAIDADQDQRE